MTVPKLIVVGSVAYDSIATPTTSEKDVLGGSATYFSLAANTLVPTGVVAVVGQDFRPEHRQLLVERGVDVTGLEVADGETFRWGGKYDDDLKERETLFTLLNVFADFSPRLPETYKSAPYVFLANIDPELQLAVLNQCTGPRFVALDTMNFWIQGKREALLELLPRIDALFLNDSEAYELTGHRNLMTAARWIRERGTPIAVIKKGEHGAIIVSEDDVVVAPAFLLEQVADPTGAGDTFAGGMMGTIAARDDSTSPGLRAAAAMGTVTASFCVEAFGPSKLAALDRTALNQRLDAYRKLVRIPDYEV
jgi:sugar/nucleoside kinase (ribokinase family)